MKKLVFVLVVALLFGTTAMAIDIGCSTHANWWTEPDAKTVMENIAASVPVSMEIFSSTEEDALADWVVAHTGNGQADLLILTGWVPTTIYTGGNAQPDGSIAELFLDDGNCIINTGDWFFYVSSPNNGDGGLVNLMDVPGISMAEPIVDVTPTDDGKLYTPSFSAFSPSRPWHLDQFDGTDWTPELIMGVNADGTRADPAIIVNTVTGGRVGSFFQVNGALVDEKSAVMSEWINNWYLLNVSPAGPARDPIPAGGDVDVLRDGALTWTPGPYSGTHNVYLGESFDDVNSATVPTASNLTDPSFDHGRLEFGKTYYWRVDEVNASPDKTVYSGKVWSFTVEPYAIQIAGSDIIATASSSSNDFSLPENTINGSGLDENNVHSIDSDAMWFTEMNDENPWIQFEFDAVKKLDTMKVWNSNSSAEGFIGYGIKQVKLEYSKDGETWEILQDANEFSQATASPTYDQYDEIAFGGVAAKMVRLNIQSNFGGFMQAYSLSEVQFNMIPASARTPEPASGSTDIVPNAVVSWRAGREAAQSTVYVSTDPNEVADGLAPSATSNTNSLDLSSFDLQMGETYYWCVDEVNNAEAESVWAGPVWSLSTVAALVVDDFESYSNDSPNRPFQAWLDGYGYSPDEFFPAGYNGNGTGAGVGHDIWSVASDHYNADIMETVNTISGSSQSMPLYYSNAGETTRTFAVPQDWTKHGIQALSLWFNGQADNAGQLYVKINGTKLLYDGSITRTVWKLWSIDLSTVGNVSNVTSLTIGVQGAGASGMLLIDDIQLNDEVREFIPEITSPGDIILGVPNDGLSTADDNGWPAGEAPEFAIDDDASTKLLHFKGNLEPTGIRITPQVGATIVTQMTFTTANDHDDRDPVTFELSGSITSIDGPYTLIATGDIVDFMQETAWPRFTKNQTAITFDNEVAYTHYQILMTVRNPAIANSMQIGEIELIGTILGQ